MEFKSNTPCNDCPYRKDAPRQKWHRSEFEKLARNEGEQFGPIYGCHKQNGSVCVGWLMNQDDHGFPNLNLRMKMSREGITREYLDSLHCPSPRFKDVKEMIEANYR